MTWRPALAVGGTGKLGISSSPARDHLATRDDPSQRCRLEVRIDDGVAELFQLPDGTEPVDLIPIGWPA